VAISCFLADSFSNRHTRCCNYFGRTYRAAYDMALSVIEAPARAPAPSKWCRLRPQFLPKFRT